MGMERQILLKNSWSVAFFFRPLSFLSHLFSFGRRRPIPNSKRIKLLSHKIIKELCRLDALEQPDRVFELSILLCGDREIQKLNEKYRGKKKPTDVLSFPLLSFPQKKRIGPPLPHSLPLPLGDIVISWPSCIRQAKLEGHTEEGLFLESEFIRLLIHGILHLFGYEHESSKKDELLMQKREKLLYGLLRAHFGGGVFPMRKPF